ncbi:Ion transport protein-domain-containing protein [Gongronella butleri]|nr:Ion transport protein-domain-containing protein [Gongronella butleri]
MPAAHTAIHMAQQPNDREAQLSPPVWPPPHTNDDHEDDTPFLLAPRAAAQKRYQPLTADRLAKKNKLDALKQEILLSKKHARVAAGARRRSIASGQISRVMDVDDHPRHGSNGKKNRSVASSMDTVPSNAHSMHTRPDDEDEHDDNIARLAHTSRSTISRSLRSYLLSDSPFAHGSLTASTLPSRRNGPSSPFMHRTRQSVKSRHHHHRHRHSYHRRLDKFLALSSSTRAITTPDASNVFFSSSATLLKAWTTARIVWYHLAARVAETRSCESAAPPSRLSVSNLMALGTYLHALRQGYDAKQAIKEPNLLHDLTDDDDDDLNTLSSSFHDGARPLRSPLSSRTPSPIPSSSFSPSPSPTPHTPLLARESPAQDRQDGPLSTPEPMYKRAMARARGFLYDLRHAGTQFAIKKDDDHDIRLKGWSMWLFSPSSPVRLCLWKVIASRSYEALSLLLLIIQWISLSVVTIRDHEQKTRVNHPQMMILMAINVLLVLEMAVKIIVYGFFVDVASESRPRVRKRVYESVQESAFGQWISRLVHSPPLHSVARAAQTAAASAAGAAGQERLPFIAHAVDHFFDDDVGVSNHHHGPSQPQTAGGSASTSTRSASPLPPWMSPRHGAAGASSTAGSMPYVVHSPLSGASRSPSRQNGQNSPGIRPHSIWADDTSDTSPSSWAPSISLQYLKIEHVPFMRDLRNIIDLVSVIAFWLHIGLLTTSNTFIPILPAIAATRILRLLLITDGTKVILQSLYSCLDMLATTLGFFAVFWLVFAMMALHLFTNSFSRQCAIVDVTQLSLPLIKDTIELAQPRQACNGYFVDGAVVTRVYDVDTGQFVPGGAPDGFACQMGQLCVQSAAYVPFWSYLSFENIYFAVLNVFTVISTEGWTDMLYMSQDAVSSSAAAVFYCLCIYLMTLILVPMFIAAITSSLASLRSYQQASAFTMGKRQSRLLIPTFGLSGGASSSSGAAGGGTGGTGVAHDDMWTFFDGVDPRLRDQSHRLQQWAHAIIIHPYYSMFGAALVLCNTVVLAIACSYPPDKLPTPLFFMDRALNYTFALDILARLYGLGPRFWAYMVDRIDLIIVVGAMSNLLLVSPTSRLYQFLQIFAVCRCYRLIYLFPKSLELLSSMIGDGRGILNLTVFTMVVLFLLTPISMQLFGGDFGFQGPAGLEDPAMRFDSFYQAFLSLYQIMTGENWTDILYDAMHSQAYFMTLFAAIFMIMLYFAVHYMVLNMFIAVIMENFDLEEDEIRQIQVKKYVRQHRWQPEYFQLDTISKIFLPVFMKQEQKPLHLRKLPNNLVANVNQAHFLDFIHTRKDRVKSDATAAPPPLVSQAAAQARRRSSVWSATSLVEEMSRDKEGDADEANAKSIWDTTNEQSLVKYGDEYELNVAKENKAVLAENMGLFRSFIFLEASHPVRHACQRWVHSAVHGYVMIVLVSLSAGMAIYADGAWTRVHPRGAEAMDVIQWVLFALFLVDIIVQMVVYGMIVLPASYLRSAWQVVDLLLLIAQPVIATNGMTPVRARKVLRCLRTVRIMNLVHYVPGMQTIFLDTLYGLPKLVDAAVLNLLAFIPFAIYGCFLFGGRFRSCNDDDAAFQHACAREFITPLDDDLPAGILMPRVWANPYQYSYDHFGKAMLHLFECASGEGWIMSLFSAMSLAPTPTMQPRFSWYSTSVWYSLYYVAFMFIASICSIQLFIGVFLEAFKQRYGISSLTNYQRQFQDLQRRLNLVKPLPHVYRAQGRWREACYNIIVEENGWFRPAALYVTILNIVVFCSSYLHQPSWVTLVQDALIALCIVFYLMELSIKALGLGWHMFALSLWNIYDLVVTPLCLVAYVLRHVFGEFFVFDVFYVVLQALVCFRLCQKIDSLDTLIGIGLKSFVVIIYIAFGYFLVQLCFLVVFEEFFDRTAYGPYGSNHVHFRSFFTGFIVLFRITTGENWDFLMHDFAQQPPNCVADGDCGSTAAAYTLFLLYYVVCTYIFENLFTVVVINNFSFTFDKRSQFTQITRTDIRQFKQAWMKYDPAATGYIRKSDIPRFLQTLQGALSIHVYDDVHRMDALLRASERVDADITHIVSIPLPTRINKHKHYTTPNILNERFYNYAQVNRQLASMDTQSVRDRKHAYQRLYHELMLSTEQKGIEFKSMLIILVLRQVDATKALKFDEFVAWSRKQDEIDKVMAHDRMRNAVNMLVQRQKYLRERQQKQETQVYDLQQRPSPSNDDDNDKSGLLSLRTSPEGSVSPGFRADPRNSTFFEQPFNFLAPTTGSSNHGTNVGGGGSSSGVRAPSQSPPQLQLSGELLTRRQQHHLPSIVIDQSVRFGPPPPQLQQQQPSASPTSSSVRGHHRSRSWHNAASMQSSPTPPLHPFATDSRTNTPQKSPLAEKSRESTPVRVSENSEIGEISEIDDNDIMIARPAFRRSQSLQSLRTAAKMNAPVPTIATLQIAPELLRPFSFDSGPSPRLRLSTDADDDAAAAALGTFTTYYAHCASIDDMPVNDGVSLMHELRRTSWSEMLYNADKP